MLSFIIAAILNIAPVPASSEGLKVWSANAIDWTEQRAGGTQRAVLEGDLAAPGKIVTYAFHLPAGTWFPPHTHATVARVFVLKGALLLGLGGTADHQRVRRIGMGQAVLVPAGLAHYEGADEDTVIVGVAEGPWTTTILPKP